MPLEKQVLNSDLAIRTEQLNFQIIKNKKGDDTMLTANQKYIDTANIKHLLGAGEKNADKIQIAVDRYYHQTDLSDCLFTLRAVNSGGGLVMQNLEKEVTESQIILTWTITEDFTAVSGELLPEIVGQKDDTVVIKYEMTPMVVRNSILEQYNGGIDAIDKALREIQSILAQAEQLVAKAPIIQNGTWWLYDAATGDYVDSGYPAQGDKGDTGETGAAGEKGDPGEPGTPGKDGTNGVDGKDGADGYSPTATVTETDAGAVISITDKNGTTTATIKNGTSGESASWGDYTPGCEEGESAKYCTAKLVTVTGKQTWQVLPSISTVSHNALDIVPDGLFVLDLSPDVDTLKESAHTHDNKEFLDGIETYLHSTYSKVTAEREAADNNLATRIKALEDSVGDISTALATMVEV
nr:MAG TPA: collagen triple helix repeat protein [Caudoviricetes sp.]